jgi:hypothetical protein
MAEILCENIWQPFVVRYYERNTFPAPCNCHAIYKLLGVYSDIQLKTDLLLSSAKIAHSFCKNTGAAPATAPRLGSAAGVPPSCARLRRILPGITGMRVQ